MTSHHPLSKFLPSRRRMAMIGLFAAAALGVLSGCGGGGSGIDGGTAVGTDSREAVYVEFSQPLDTNASLSALRNRPGGSFFAIVSGSSASGDVTQPGPEGIYGRMLQTGIANGDEPLTIGAPFAVERGGLGDDRVGGWVLHYEIVDAATTRIWEGVSGTVTVLAIEGEYVTFRMDNVRMEPKMPGGSAAVGSFTLSGTVLASTDL